MLLKDDIRTVRQLENKIEKNKVKFEKFLNNNLFHIKGRRLLDILSRSGMNYSEMNSNLKNSFSDEEEFSENNEIDDVLNSEFLRNLSTSLQPGVMDNKKKERLRKSIVVGLSKLSEMVDEESGSSSNRQDSPPDHNKTETMNKTGF